MIKQQKKTEADRYVDQIIAMAVDMRTANRMFYDEPIAFRPAAGMILGPAELAILRIHHITIIENEAAHV